MKRKAVSFAAALAVCVLLATMPQTSGMKASAASNAPLDGIDYTRLTQKASTAMSDFDVRMKIGDVEIRGLFAGSEGLTMGEINEIVLSQLSLMNLDLQEIAVLSSLGENLERMQWMEFGKKLAVALSEYIPSVGPGDSVNPTDLVKYVLYGNDPIAAAPGRFINGKTKQAIEDAATDALQKQAAKMGKRIPKQGGGLWLVGFALNSVSAGADLLDDTEYDKFCRRLEDEYQKVAEFYAKCGQKLNDEAELKNFGRGVIMFDEYSAATSECTFLGVDGVRLRYKLSGMLKKQAGPDDTVTAGDNSGTYEGDLKLEIEGFDLANDFDAVFADRSTLWMGSRHYSDWSQILYKFDGTAAVYRDALLDKFIFTVNRPTYLKRTLVGHFRVVIPKAEIKGKMTPVLSGSFNNVSDGIDFLFRMTFGQELRTHATKLNPYGIPVDIGAPVQQWHVETLLQGAKSISSLHCTWVGNEAARVEFEGSVGEILYGGAGQDIIITPADLGTVWKQLEEAPVMTISVFD